MPPNLLVSWRGLRSRILANATLHPTIPDYISWGEFNKDPGRNPAIEDKMGEILAYVFSAFQPTHILGILDAGAGLAQAVSRHLPAPEITYAIKYVNPPVEHDGIVVEGRSYKTQGRCWFGVPNFAEGSAVLVIDDVAARYGAGGPVLGAVSGQSGVRVAWGVGMDKDYQGWVEQHGTGHPDVPAFSVVRVAEIDNAAGQFCLMAEREALRVI
ncbi:hypothetical protein HY214_04530 [Candidatus Roizmanbacteria bacterium]|nr:hypothetical protein [Candidatus Roizmanbacteria bacterium]